MMFPAASLSSIAPELILAGGAVALLMLDLVGFGRATRSPCFCSLFGVIVGLLAAAAMLFVPAGPEAFGGQLKLDGLAWAGRVVILGALLVTLVASPAYLKAFPVQAAEYVSLLILAAVGLMGVAAAANWLVLFVCLELAAVSTAALVGQRRQCMIAREAALKYFILSAFASAFLLYGIAIEFFTGGSFALGPLGGDAAGARLALLLIIAGLAFKCALVPFHMWAPDTYHGGPTPVIGFLASASKAVGFIVLARVLFPDTRAAGSGPALAIISAISMLTGTFLALTQSNLKRMLAYSGIAHAGYLALALTAGGHEALRAMMIYLPVYAAMTLGAFVLFSAAESAGIAPDFKAFAGFGRRAPLAGAALAVFMISLTGLPPTAGFIAKFSVFREALAAGHLPLVLLALALSVVSVGFYLRLLVPVFMEAGPEEPLSLPPAGVTVAVLLALALLAAGIFPAALVSIAGLAAG